MKIALYGKPYENSLNSSVGGIVSAIKNAGLELSIYEKYAKFLVSKGYLSDDFPTFTRKDVTIDEYLCLVSIGGDGTLLDTVSIIGGSGVPVIGLNAGRLGFISSISMDEFEGVLETLLDKTFRCNERTLIRVDTDRELYGKTNFALNELTVLKKDSASMISIDVFIDDEYLNTYWADGLIIATPTGSTAYSLSCGGPIVFPGSENVVVTPIAPHNLNLRPAVISNDTEIKLKVGGRSEEFLLSIDSRSRAIKPGEIVKITKAPFRFNLLQPKGHSFITTMRNKLAWGYDKRNAK